MTTWTYGTYVSSIEYYSVRGVEYSDHISLRVKDPGDELPGKTREEKGA